jgi:hypothetical protein
MSRLGGWILAIIICLTPAAFASVHRERIWREGELTSRKTFRARHTRIEYLYRLQAGGLWYRVLSDEPLSLSLHTPVQFEVGRRHILIRDGNGTERKVLIIEKGNLSFHH